MSLKLKKISVSCAGQLREYFVKLHNLQIYCIIMCRNVNKKIKKETHEKAKKEHRNLIRKSCNVYENNRNINKTGNYSLRVDRSTETEVG